MNTYTPPDLEQIRREIEARGWAGYEHILSGIIDDQRREIETMRCRLGSATAVPRAARST